MMVTSTSFRSEFRSLSGPARVLIVNGFGGSVGFYMVLPFLAVYLTDDLGYGAAVVGLVLGLRLLSQHGMFPIGGVAADRIGCRPMIIVGCALRVVAYGLFATFTSLPAVTTATVLTGLSAALFTPAARTYLIAESGGQRARAFAVDKVSHDAGAMLGPLLGALLLTVDFRIVALLAGVVFAVLTVAQLLALPPRAVQHLDRGVLGSWWEVLTNRRFMAFALFCSAELALFNQLYLALPLEAQRVTGSESSVSAVFLLYTMTAIAIQVRITAGCRTRWSAGTCVALGLAVQGAGFLPLMISGPWLPTGLGASSVGAAALAITPVLISTVVFSVGMMIAFPFVMALLPVVGSERLTGTYYGIFYLMSAITAGLVSWIAGGLIELTDPAWRWTPGAALLMVGLTAATGIAIMQRRGTLTENRADGP